MGIVASIVVLGLRAEGGWRGDGGMDVIGRMCQRASYVGIVGLSDRLPILEGLRGRVGKNVSPVCRCCWSIRSKSAVKSNFGFEQILSAYARIRLHGM